MRKCPQTTFIQRLPNQSIFIFINPGYQLTCISVNLQFITLLQCKHNIVKEKQKKYRIVFDRRYIKGEPTSVKMK